MTLLHSLSELNECHSAVYLPHFAAAVVVVDTPSVVVDAAATVVDIEFGAPVVVSAIPLVAVDFVLAMI